MLHYTELERLGKEKFLLIRTIRRWQRKTVFKMCQAVSFSQFIFCHHLARVLHYTNLGLTGKNTLAYKAHSLVTKKNHFKRCVTWRCSATKFWPARRQSSLGRRSGCPSTAPRRWSERSGANDIKLFCPWLTNSHTKIVFVRLSWKSLLGTNTLAYYKNS